MVEYGAGPALDADFDFSVDSSGDIAGSFGEDELGKDLSFNVSAALVGGRGVERPPDMADGVVGERLDDGTIRDIEVVVAKIISRDVRVDEVRAVNAERVSGESFDVSVEATMIALGGQVEFEQVISS